MAASVTKSLGTFDNFSFFKLRLADFVEWSTTRVVTIRKKSLDLEKTPENCQKL